MGWRLVPTPWKGHGRQQSGAGNGGYNSQSQIARLFVIDPWLMAPHKGIEQQRWAQYSA